MENLINLLSGPIWGWYLLFASDSIPAKNINITTLLFSSLTVLLPLFWYFKRKNKKYIYLAALLWLFWGYIFTVAIWV